MYIQKFEFIAVPTAANTVLAGPIDVGHLDKFSLQFQNDNTSINFLDLSVQACVISSGSPADAAPHWVNVNTATIPVPSALGKTASFLTSAIDSTFKWIRIMGYTCATMAANVARVNVAGHFRRR